jgi:3-methyl-2-oxobutanoate hydroxymethyltransferase
MKTVLTLQKKKTDKQKLTMLTCYDACFAKILAKTDVDMILVGDSGSMVMHGNSTTLSASVENMVDFVASVRKGAPHAFIVGDMPFLAHRMGLEPAMKAVQKIMAAGASAVKIEGIQGHEALLAHIVDSGVPVMGHIGLTPQSVHQLGGYKVQGREEKAAEALLAQAKDLQQAGCFAVVLECVPTTLAGHITGALDIPTIGIGAGPLTDGQVLVLHDMLGLNTDFTPKFVRKYLNGAELVQHAVEKYLRDVVSSEFPMAQESYD